MHAQPGVWSAFDLAPLLLMVKRLLIFRVFQFFYELMDDLRDIFDPWIAFWPKFIFLEL